MLEIFSIMVNKEHQEEELYLIRIADLLKFLFSSRFSTIWKNECTYKDLTCCKEKKYRSTMTVHLHMNALKYVNRKLKLVSSTNKHLLATPTWYAYFYENYLSSASVTFPVLCSILGKVFFISWVIYSDQILTDMLTSYPNMICFFIMLYLERSFFLFLGSFTVTKYSYNLWMEEYVYVLLIFHVVQT